MADRQEPGAVETLLTRATGLKVALLYAAIVGIGIACVVIGSTLGRVVGVVLLVACVAFGLHLTRKLSARHS